MPKVICFVEPGNPIAGEAQHRIPGGWDLMMLDGASTRDDTLAAVESADFILLAHSAALTDDLLRAARSVRLIQITSAGFDAVNVGLAGQLGIPVATNGGANAIPVAEFAVTLMLATLRHLVVLDRETRAGRWMPDWASGGNTYELSGKTVGIIGAGRIGTTVARLLRGFDAPLLYTDPVASSAAESHGAQRVSLDALLAGADVVTVHVPLARDTEALIGRRELGLMKSSAILVNTSRGPIIDETALLEALRQGGIWGAGIDVFMQEPVDPENPLLGLDNCIVAPHVAGKSRESMPRRVQFAMDNMRRVWAGDRPESVVRPA